MMLTLFLSLSLASAGASCLDVDAVRDAAGQAGLGGVYGDTPRAVLANVAGATSFAPGQTTEAALWLFATMARQSEHTVLRAPEGSLTRVMFSSVMCAMTVT